MIVTDESNEIISRWFIIDTQFNRQGQWIINMRRDLVVDYYDTIVEADCFIEKAILPSWNPLTLNSEDMSFNQIKTSETFLKDKTGVAWIVGYYNNKAQAIVDSSGNPTGGVEPYLLELKDTDNVNVKDEYDIGITDGFEEWFGNGQKNSGVTNQIWEIYNINTGLYKPDCKYTFDLQLSATKEDMDSGSGSYLYLYPSTSAEQVAGAFGGQFRGPLVQYTNTYLKDSTTPPLMNQTDTDEFLALNNKKVRFGDGTIKYISISSATPRTFTQSISKGSNLGEFIFNRLSTAGLVEKGSYNDKSFKVTYTTNTYNITATPVKGTSIKLQVSNGVRQLEDASYNMFALPYPKKDETFTLGGVEMEQSVAIRVATALANKYASGGVMYDLQLVPFCPVQDIVKTDERTFDLPTSQDSYSVIYNYDDTVIGYMLHAKASSFTDNIPVNLSCANTKIENQTDMYRLCSPNFNGQFEFNLAKNGGSVDYINFDCTYLPYNPYIHLNPNFAGLYGQDFDDARGLICGGDFSLPIMNDAWQAYQLQNKNYLNSFNREIESMELKNKLGLRQDIVNAFVGAVQGAAGGAMASTALPLKFGVGAAIGGIASAIGGFADIRINQQLRADALDYTKDMFNYQLGNIQALPQSIAKTTAYTYNNKIFPILEYYTCTDTEKEAFANKIAYNSMSVGVIGKIREYQGTDWVYTINDKTITSKGYIKGSIIRMEGLEDKFHLLKNISDEIYKGVYF